MVSHELEINSEGKSFLIPDGGNLMSVVGGVLELIVDAVLGALIIHSSRKTDTKENIEGNLHIGQEFV